MRGYVALSAVEIEGDVVTTGVLSSVFDSYGIVFTMTSQGDAYDVVVLVIRAEDCESITAKYTVVFILVVIILTSVVIIVVTVVIIETVAGESFPGEESPL